MKVRARSGAALALGLWACGSDRVAEQEATEQFDAAVSESCGGATPLTPDELLRTGPHGVRTLELRLVDESRPTSANGAQPALDSRSLPTRVWFPGEGDALAAGGPFPLVVWSHSLASSNQDVVWLAEHLASRGYVVAAPLFPLSSVNAEAPTNADLPNQPGDISFVIDSLLARSTSRGESLHAAIDAERIAVAGFSLGAATTILVTFLESLRDPRIKAAVSLASASGFYGKKLLGSRKVPLLALHGEFDAFAPYNPHATSLRENASAPFWLGTIVRGTHTGFSQAGIHLDQPDELACSFDSLRTDMTPLYQALGGREAGFVIPLPALPPGAITCATADPLPSSISGERQLQLSRLLVTAFLTMHLGPEEERDAACAFLHQAVREADDSFTLIAR
jgi:dienelactone hydrolase